METIFLSEALVGGLHETRALTLERDGLVKRTVHPVVPPHVDYELTELSQTLRDPIAALERWAVLHMAQVQEAQQRYDAAHVKARV